MARWETRLWLKGGWQAAERVIRSSLKGGWKAVGRVPGRWLEEKLEGQWKDGWKVSEYNNLVDVSACGKVKMALFWK